MLPTYYIQYSVKVLWVLCTQTQLFLTPPPKKIPCQGSDLSSLGRLILKNKV